MDRIIYKVIPLTLLILTVLLLAGYGLSNYTTLLNSDSYSYLIYARSLAAGSLFGEYPLYDIFREYWPASGRVNLHSGNRHLENGRICYGVDIGYPLLLALAIVVGGLNAVHFVGPLFLIILSLAFFMLARMVFSDRPDRNILALIGLLVALLLPPGRVLLSSIKIMRDIPPLTFLVISLFFLISGRERERGGGVRIFLAALFLGLASLVRINYAVCIGPFYLYLLAPSRKRKPWRKGIVWPLVFSLVGFLSLIIPVVLIDIKINRSIFYTVRIVTNSLLIVSSSPTSLFSLTYLGRSGIWYLDFILRTYSLPLLVISLAGMIYGIRRRAVSLLFLPLLICQFIVFAVFKYKQARYLMPVYLILSFFIGYGAVVILQRIADLKARLEGRGRGIALSRILLMAAGGIVLVGAVLAYLSPLRSGPPIASLLLLAVAFLLLIPHRYRLLLIRYQYPASVVMLGLFLFLLAGILPLLRAPGFQLRELDCFKEEIEEYTPPRFPGPLCPVSQTEYRYVHALLLPEPQPARFSLEADHGTVSPDGDGHGSAGLLSR
jgi:hypothetical protein